MAAVFWLWVPLEIILVKITGMRKNPQTNVHCLLGQLQKPTNLQKVSKWARTYSIQHLSTFGYNSPVFNIPVKMFFFPHAFFWDVYSWQLEVTAHPTFHKSWRYCTRAEWKPHAGELRKDEKKCARDREGDRRRKRQKERGEGGREGADLQLEQINQAAEK